MVKNLTHYTQGAHFPGMKSVVSDIGIEEITRIATPAQIGANVNDYHPVDAADSKKKLETSVLIRISGSADGWLITGLLAPSPVVGRRVRLTNVSADAVGFVLKDKNNGSLVGNRFDFGGADFALASGRSADLFYDVVSLKWRLI